MQLFLTSPNTTSVLRKSALFIRVRQPLTQTLRLPLFFPPIWHLAADNTKKSIAIFVLLLKGNQSAQRGWMDADGRRDATLLPSSLPPSFPLSNRPSSSSLLTRRRIGYAITSHLADRSVRRPFVDPSNDPFIRSPAAAACRFSTLFTRDMLSATYFRLTEGQSATSLFYAIMKLLKAE